MQIYKEGIGNLLPVTPGKNSSAPENPQDLWLRSQVRLAREGNEAAFQALFQHYTQRISTYLVRLLGSEQEGLDLAQETFLKAWTMLPSLKDEARFSSWLYRIATNIAIDAQRRQKLRWLPWNQFPVETHQDHEPAMEGRIAEIEQIQAALAQVSPKYRSCLLLQIEGGFSQKEIAAMLSMNIKAVSVYVNRGCEQFRKAYAALNHMSPPISFSGKEML